MTDSFDLAKDQELMRRATREAGAEALRFFGGSPEVVEKKDGTQVSEADHAANDKLHEILMTARPRYGWLSEETTDDLARLDKDHVWIIDPIDGTRAFLEHKLEWAVSVALVVKSEPRFGIVFNPARDEWFEATRGGGATLNGKPIATSTCGEIENSLFVGSKSLFNNKRWSSPWPAVKTRWANSIAYRLAMVASAKADATLTHRPKSEWDMAAAALIVEEAGGRVTTFDGARLRFNCKNTRYPNILAAGRNLHPLLLERTKKFQPDEKG